MRRKNRRQPGRRPGHRGRPPGRRGGRDPKRITAPALFSVGLVDDITPASTVFAAFNHCAGPKQIEIYPFNGHDGGGTQHFLAKLAFLVALPDPS
jgi:pimeloyl-ACP methyl ester carboxylesterase